MKQSNFQDPQFWIELRRRTSLDGWIGISECFHWCDEALVLLEEFGQHQFKKIRCNLSTNEIKKYGFLIDSHGVLARRYTDRIFIADGTAGQIQMDFPFGYYGDESNAPERLKVFYKSAIRSSKIRIN